MLAIYIRRSWEQWGWISRLKHRCCGSFAWLGGLTVEMVVFGFLCQTSALCMWFSGFWIKKNVSYVLEDLVVAWPAYLLVCNLMSPVSGGAFEVELRWYLLSGLWEPNQRIVTAEWGASRQLGAAAPHHIADVDIFCSPAGGQGDAALVAWKGSLWLCRVKPPDHWTTGLNKSHVCQTNKKNLLKCTKGGSF